MTDPRAAVLAFCARPLSPVLALEEGDAVRLFEPASGKELRLRWSDLASVEERRSPLRPLPYLLLRFHDGRELALAEVGIAFAPSLRNTGPLPDAPAALCFSDYRHLLAGIGQLLAEEGREREALQAVMLCIALLDGAREAGFDVSREERTLEEQLRLLESRGAL